MNAKRSSTLSRNPTNYPNTDEMNKDRFIAASFRPLRNIFMMVMALFIGPIQPAIAENISAVDLRVAKPKDLNTKRTFPEIISKSEWETRAKEIREQILVSCGL